MLFQYLFLIKWYLFIFMMMLYILSMMHMIVGIGCRRRIASCWTFAVEAPVDYAITFCKRRKEKIKEKKIHDLSRWWIDKFVAERWPSTNSNKLYEKISVFNLYFLKKKIESTTHLEWARSLNKFFLQ